MNNLSIFVDESGDFGQYRPHSPYYIIAMVLHEQSKNLSSEITKLNIELENLGYKNPVVHTEPLIRREEDYLNMTPGNAEVFLQSYFTFYPDAMSGINLLSSIHPGAAPPEITVRQPHPLRDAYLPLQKIL